MQFIYIKDLVLSFVFFFLLFVFLQNPVTNKLKILSQKKIKIMLYFEVKIPHQSVFFIYMVIIF